MSNPASLAESDYTRKFSEQREAIANDETTCAERLL
jgi:hypothetical protein